MTQIEKIVAEIERLMKWKPKAIPSGMRQRDVLNIRKGVLLTLKDFIKYLPAEQPSEDFKGEFDDYLVHGDIRNPNFEGPFGYDDIRKTAIHFAQWQKEQMMKNCLYNTEVMLHTKQNNIEYLTLANDKLPHIPVSLGLNVSDKVKVIIIKEDEQ